MYKVFLTVSTLNNICSIRFKDMVLDPCLLLYVLLLIIIIITIIVVVVVVVIVVNYYLLLLTIKSPPHSDT